MELKTSITEDFSKNEVRTLEKSKNILAKIDGSKNGKALLSLSHDDRAPHSFSKGGCDDGSGAITII